MSIRARLEKLAAAVSSSIAERLARQMGTVDSETLENAVEALRSAYEEQHAAWTESLVERLNPCFSESIAAQLYGPLVGKRLAFDVERAAYALATFESAQYFLEHLRMAVNTVTCPDLLRYALSKCEVDGLIMEFGVFVGTTLKIIAEESPDSTVFGFDSFLGLPEDWTHFQKKGRFNRAGKPPADMPENVEFVVGLFEETIPPFLETHSGPIRFLHVDSDLYSSAVTILEGFADRIVPGTVIVFNEYFNYPGWQHHEVKAFGEFMEKHHAHYEYFAFASSHFSVAIRITDINATA